MSPRPVVTDERDRALLASLRGARIARACAYPSPLPGDPPVLVLELLDGRALVLAADEEGNPGGALHVLDAAGALVGVAS